MDVNVTKYKEFIDLRFYFAPNTKEISFSVVLENDIYNYLKKLLNTSRFFPTANFKVPFSSTKTTYGNGLKAEVDRRVQLPSIMPDIEEI